LYLCVAIDIGDKVQQIPGYNDQFISAARVSCHCITCPDNHLPGKWGWILHRNDLEDSLIPEDINTTIRPGRVFHTQTSTTSWGVTATLLALVWHNSPNLG
jgi:hypothetical protein